MSDVLDATTGGKHIWHGEMKEDDRVVFADRRAVPEGELELQPNWSVAPDVKADYRALPFAGESFDRFVVVSVAIVHLLRLSGIGEADRPHRAEMLMR